MHTLEVGESVTVHVESRPRWFRTGIYLTAGGGYRLSATGSWTDWKPKYTCTPDGYKSDSWMLRAAERLRSAPSDRWFALVGAIGADKHAQWLIGSNNDHKPARSGELTCFANDVWFMRWNNRGCVSLTVTRTS